MFERIKDCICHPRNIGKYNKDSIGIVLLTIFLFFVLALSMQGVRSFTENPFDEYSSMVVSSAVIQHGDNNVIYDSNSHKITGDSLKIEGNGFQLIILPTEEQITVGRNSVNIILKEEEAIVYYSASKVSSIVYRDIQVAGFKLGDVALNHSQAIYNFKIFIDSILDSSRIYFQVSTFLRGALTTFVYYLICVLFSFVLSISINPSIDKGVRTKLSFYDGCSFLVGSFFAYLFNASIIVYFALPCPLIFAFITFRHIVRVIIRK